MNKDELTEQVFKWVNEGKITPLQALLLLEIVFPPEITCKKDAQQI